MNRLFCLLLLFTACTPVYKKLHHSSTLTDTHNDILTTCLEHGYSFDQNLSGKTHSDLQRMRQSGLAAQVFSVWCDGDMKNPFAYANRQIDTLYQTIGRNPDAVQLLHNSAAMRSVMEQKKLAALIGVEGGHMIEDKLDNLDALYNRGIRYLTLTWNNSTPWATSAMTETGTGYSGKKGLSDFGKTVVRRMNELGMLVDVSHVGEQTFWDAINTSTKPVIASHSSVHALCPVFRNLKDDQIKAIGQKGGVVFINFYSGFIDSSFNRKMALFQAAHKQERDSLLKLRSEPYFADEFLATKYKDEMQAMRPPFSLLIDHIDYVVKLIGTGGVGIGSDFDGVTSLPQGINSVLDYPKITRELLRRGYSKNDVRNILGGNFLRVLQAAEQK